MGNFDLFRSAKLPSNAKSIGVDVKDTQKLAASLSHGLKEEKRAEVDYDVEKCLEQKMAMGKLQMKANELEHTTNTGYGAELVPGSILMTDFLDFAPKINPLLANFRGYHGRTMDLSMKVAAIGEVPLHDLMPEQTGSALSFTTGKGKLPTDKIQIDQKEYYFDVDISEWEARFSIVDILAIVKQKLADSAARTIIASIINGDPATGANTNINSIDGTPAGTEYYLGGTGLRATAIAAGASQLLNAGTFDFTDFTSLMSLLGNNAVAEDLVYILGTATKNKGLTITEFLQAYLNGLTSTAITGKLPEFLGSSYSVQRHLALADATGKVATTTPANNTKGSMIVAHKDAVQWGFNGDYNMEIYRVPGKGFKVIGWYFMGYAIANKLAGTDPTVALAYNITV